MYAIYKITNLKNSKVYIGYSSDYRERWKTHLTESQEENVGRKVLYLSMKKHGLENFLFEVIYCGFDAEHTKNVMEPHFIREYNSRLPNGYNMTRGGDCGPGMTSEFASEMNRKQVAEGRHVFQREDFRKAVAKRMSNSNPMNNPEVKAKQSKSNSSAQRKMVEDGTHYFKSEEYRAVSSARMAVMKSRPLVKEVRDLFVEIGGKIPRSLHTTSDEKLLALKLEAEQRLARLQGTSFNFLTVS